MRQHVQKLYQISQAKERKIIGLMSGTSLDGLDIALCVIRGNGMRTKITQEHFTTIAYDESFRQAVQHVFAKQNINQSHFCWLNANIARVHAKMVLTFLRSIDLAPESIDLIASHGQTVFHYPNSLRQAQLETKYDHESSGKGTTPLFDNINSTLQLGDGDHLASLTGIITLSDFRQKHIANGGEGAPLAMYGDFLMMSSTKEDRCLINIGGIANLTYLAKGAYFDQIICSDIGPGNTIMDALINTEFPEQRFDEGGKIAASGQINIDLLRDMQSHPFIALAMPKTTGPELFNLAWFSGLVSATEDKQNKPLLLADKLATLNEFSAWCIAQHVLSLPADTQVYLSGGGIHNSHLCKRLSELLARKIQSTQALNIDPDAKEAVLFALLANECVAGEADTFSSPTSNNPNNANTSMGKVSFPN